MIDADRSMWMVERENRSPIFQGMNTTTLFITVIWVTDYDEGIVHLFEYADAYIDKHELSKH